MTMNKSITGRLSALSMAFATAATLGLASGAAEALPAGWTCTGNCGTLGANGVVTAPPNGTTYDYISTDNAPSYSALGLGSETTGTQLASNIFPAAAGETLEFYFNYITSDGSGFADYAFARLVNQANPGTPIYLVTARTVPAGSIIPGAGMPGISATLTPASVPIIPGGPAWSPLGGSSGGCFAAGCGYTGWVKSEYTILAAGNYQLEFGTVNWDDSAFDSGLALSGAALCKPGDPICDPIGGVPEPGTLALFGLAALGMGAVRRRRQTR